MDGTDVTLLVTLVALLVAAVVLGASEAALLRVQRVRVEVAAGDGDRGATRVVGARHALATA